MSHMQLLPYNWPPGNGHIPSLRGAKIMQSQVQAAEVSTLVWCQFDLLNPPLDPNIPIQEYQDAINTIPAHVRAINPQWSWRPNPHLELTWEGAPIPRRNRGRRPKGNAVPENFAYVPPLLLEPDPFRWKDKAKNAEMNGILKFEPPLYGAEDPAGNDFYWRRYPPSWNDPRGPGGSGGSAGGGIFKKRDGDTGVVESEIEIESKPIHRSNRPTK
ncbi:hypothetical protein TWF730_003018 [Orbilia blumenaviensis]|uniref:Uncharacterized protein n=1 Tax=Orbilia blumenaviensis TaxID=1796055 RepID=A0AAV9UC42_9PEZI